MSQEAFVKACVALPDFKQGSAFRPLLWRIVTNVALNRQRSNSRRANRMNRAVRRSGWTAPRLAENDPEEATLAKEQQEMVLRALASLQGTDRDVLT